MASILRLSPITHLQSGLRHSTSRRLHHRPPRCEGRSPSDGGSKSENAVLRVAWYGSELLGIAASFFRSSSPTADPANEASNDSFRSLAGREQVAEAIKVDFARSYFVTGNLTLEAYEDDCEFADPAGSFRGLRRFKRNCSNFGSLLETSNMKLTKWEDFEDKSIGHWRFSCIMSFPWRPILSDGLTCHTRLIRCGSPVNDCPCVLCLRWPACKSNAQFVRMQKKDYELDLAYKATEKLLSGALPSVMSSKKNNESFPNEAEAATMEEHQRQQAQVEKHVKTKQDAFDQYMDRLLKRAKEMATNASKKRNYQEL
ncbi:hypothetical protein Cni_G15020 [Canna indica]|uniref:Uncharacterized protein n=1 Tax=Canna indica TaxID=4628 RepID=A0AAQ3KCK0_9LILI|nr:hypothetical protein Cni_G15020 [Canna indica]